MVRPGHVLAVVLGCMGPALWPAPPARAQTEEQREEAKRRFTQGSEKFLARRYAEALEDLRASHRLVPSPNSGLLIARCLRELKRPVEAYETYASVAADARKRAADDPKYVQTAEAADAEGAVVRATLGSIRVRVLHAPPGSSIEMDGSAWPANESGIAVLHIPGEVQVKLRNAAGGEQSQRATVVSGAEVHVEFDAGAGPATPPPPPPRKDRIEPPPPAEGPPPAWTLPAALIAGGVTLAGTGMFIGFGLQSESIYSRLQKRCGPAACGPADKAEADAGKRDQTIANVGLAVGIAGAASLVAFLLIRAYAPRSSGSSASHALVPSGLHLTF